MVNFKQIIYEIGKIILELAIIVAFVWLLLSGYWWAIILIVCIYSAYVIYKGWSQVQMLMTMIDGLVYKWKLSRKVKHDNNKRYARHN